MRLLTPLVLSLLLFVGTAHASSTIIADYFNRSGQLAGTMANPTGGVWGGSTTYTTNSGVVTVASGGSGSFCFQPVTFLQNSVYTLSVVMTNTFTGSGNTIGFGFGGTELTGDLIVLGGTGLARAIEGSTGSLSTYASDSGAVFGNFTMVLTTNTNPSTSTMSYFRNGNAIGAPNNVVDSSGYTQVFLTDFANVTGTFAEFTLTGPTVPEPSSLLLLSVAGLGLMCRRR